MKKLILIAFLCFAFACKENTSNDNNDASNTVEFIDKHEIERVEPPNWWIGFENDSLQLLVKHEEIANYSADRKSVV